MSIPLRAIHYFVEAARAQSFSVASQRLHVSQSAVSHQIKGLEDFLGHPLFVRRGRDILLTALGEQYLQQVAPAIDTISHASIDMKQQKSRQLKLALHGSLAVKWLIPALDDFRLRYPNIDLSLQMLTQAGRFDTQFADCFITTQPPRSGFTQYHLYDERLKPYCAKPLWSEAQQLREPHLLTQFPLLSAASVFSSNQPGEDWRRWFAAVQQPLPPHTKIHHFSHVLLAVEAAKYGQGIALLNEFMTSTAERADSLYELPLHSIRTDDSFYFVYPNQAAKRIGLEALGKWLVALCKEKSL